MSLKRANHCVDVLWPGHEDHGGGSLRHLVTEFVEQGAAKPWTGVFAGDTPGHPAAHHSDGEPRGTEQQPSRCPGHRAFGRLAPDELPLVVRVHVMPCERPADDDSIASMVLDERDLFRPWIVRRLARRIAVGALGAAGVPEHHQCEIDAHRLHQNSTLRVPQPPASPESGDATFPVWDHATRPGAPGSGPSDLPLRHTQADLATGAC